MAYRIEQHTADIRLSVWAKTLAELLNSALQGMAAIQSSRFESFDSTTMTLPIQRTISLEAADTTMLFIDFLSEVLLQSHLNREVYLVATFNRLSETSLEAVVHGTKLDNFEKDIKAVTYHEADVRQNAQGDWATAIVFDI